MGRLVCLLLVVCPVSVFAQFTYAVDQTIPVADASGTPIALPWAGGLNAAHYNSLDVDHDGKEDLILFDRMADRVVTLLNVDGQYRYAPQYESLFPELANWLLLRDFNCDGKKDIFTGDPFGIRVYLNTTPDNGNLQWNHVTFYTQPGSPRSPVLLTRGFSGLINLQTQFDDLPSIEDIDGDGDLDILAPNWSGDGTIEFHRNYSRERYNSCDSLEFERVSQRWGGLKTCECGEFAFDGDDCAPNSTGRIKHSQGKALLAHDFDNDLDHDLLISDGNCTVLYYLENTGDAETAAFIAAVEFPVGDPADFPLFPTPFLEDVDFDGIRDLMVTPNIFVKDHLEINLKESNWFYRNAGTNQLPDYSAVARNFLQDQMIDVGDNAVPAFFDIDGDGDPDLIIGQMNDRGTHTGSLTLYENTGTPGSPAFRLATTDYLNFSGHGFYNIRPQFHDADGDGRIDLVFTATNSSTDATALYALHNQANSGFDAGTGSPAQISFDMLFSENVHLADVDLDGLPDILVGRSNGSVQYWRNNGPKGSINLVLEKSEYLGFVPSVERQSLSMTTADLNADGKTDLVLGDQYGQLSIISDFRQTSQEVELLTDLIHNSITDTYGVKNLGGRIWPAVANLFPESRPAIITGNLQGGLQVLRNDSDDPAPGEPLFLVFPNPLSSNENLTVRTDRLATLQLVSILGQELTPPVVVPPFQYHAIALPTLAAGVYILRITADTRNYSRRIVIF